MGSNYSVVKKPQPTDGKVYFKAVDQHGFSFHGDPKINYLKHVGQTLRIRGDPIMCEHGFHMCENLLSTMVHIPSNESKPRYFKVGIPKTADRLNGGDKIVTSQVTIIGEMAKEEVHEMTFQLGIRVEARPFNPGYYNYFEMDVTGWTIQGRIKPVKNVDKGTGNDLEVFPVRIHASRLEHYLVFRWQYGV